MLYLSKYCAISEEKQFCNTTKTVCSEIRNRLIFVYAPSFDTFNQLDVDTFFLTHGSNKPGKLRCSRISRRQTSKWLAESSIRATIVVMCLCLLLLCFHSSSFVKVGSAHIHKNLSCGAVYGYFRLCINIIVRKDSRNCSVY